MYQTRRIQEFIKDLQLKLHEPVQGRRFPHDTTKERAQSRVNKGTHCGPVQSSVSPKQSHMKPVREERVIKKRREQTWSVESKYGLPQQYYLCKEVIVNVESVEKDRYKLLCFQSSIRSSTADRFCSTMVETFGKGCENHIKRCETKAKARYNSKSVRPTPHSHFELQSVLYFRLEKGQHQSNGSRVNVKYERMQKGMLIGMV